MRVMDAFRLDIEPARSSDSGPPGIR